MQSPDQGIVRWLILGALLLGAAVWYSWTGHRPGAPPLSLTSTQTATAQPPDLVSTGIEVEAAAPQQEAEPQPTAE
jgi:hypothetical protein